MATTITISKKEYQINKKSIIIGWLVDIGASIGMSAVAVFISAAFFFRRLMAEKGIQLEDFKKLLIDNDINKLFIENFYNNYFIFILLCIIGLFTTALGGYVAAHIAKIRELTHALIVGILTILISGFMYVINVSEIPLSPWLYLPLSYPFLLPAALLGGYLSKIVNERKHDKGTRRKLASTSIILLIILATLILLSAFSAILGLNKTIMISGLLYAAAFVGVGMRRKWGVILVYLIASLGIIDAIIGIFFYNRPPIRIGMIIIGLILIFLAYKERKLLAS